MNITEATFLADPPTFVIAGIVIALLLRLKKLPIPTLAWRYHWALGWMAIFAIGFIAAAELPCYFDAMPQPGFSATKTCNEFMWHGYLNWPFSWITGHPPIPSYKEWWSTLWLAANFAFQAALGFLAVSMTFQDRFFGNPDNWSRPKRT